MSRWIGSLIVGCSAVGAALAQGPGGRLYFDLAGNGGDEVAPHPGSTSKINPDVRSGDRLYIYWEFGGEDQKVLSPNFDVEVDGGTITEAYYYNNQNIACLFGPRWNRSSPRPPVNPGGPTVEMKAGSIDKFALKNDAVARTFDTQYAQFDGAFGSTILGYVDVTTPSVATVWFRTGWLGIAILGGGPMTPIYFGFGDGPVYAGSRDRSTHYDASVGIPEPATAILLFGLGGLALRRRD